MHCIHLDIEDNFMCKGGEWAYEPSDEVRDAYCQSSDFRDCPRYRAFLKEKIEEWKGLKMDCIHYSNAKCKSAEIVYDPSNDEKKQFCRSKFTDCPRYRPPSR